MRLIDADKVIERINGTGYAEQTKSNLRFMVDMQPTIDAVEVVRCGECKHMIADGRCMEFADDGIRPSVTDFCSYGERKTDEIQTH